MIPQDADEALTEGALARRLNVSVSALRNWRSHGRGPRFVKFGRSVRYMPHDVEQYVSKSLAGPRKPEDSQHR